MNRQLEETCDLCMCGYSSRKYRATLMQPRNNISYFALSISSTNVIEETSKEYKGCVTGSSTSTNLAVLDH